MKTKKMPRQQLGGTRANANANAVALARRAVSTLHEPEDLLVVVLFVEELVKRNSRVKRRH